MLMEKILPYLEFKSNAQSNNFEVENYIGMNIETVKAMLDKSKIKYEIIGEGNAVISQIPQGGEILTKDISKIIIYTTKEEQNHIVVPNLIGLSGKDAIIRATNAGLSVRILGISSIEPTSLDIVSEQSLPPGEVVKNGSVITIRILRTDYND
jgi:beta-lactam-binding protein with PASTA domain